MKRINKLVCETCNAEHTEQGEFSVCFDNLCQKEICSSCGHRCKDCLEDFCGEHMLPTLLCDECQTIQNKEGIA